MDYQLNIYPSSEKEMQNVKADNNTKQIKMLVENKLQQLYKQTFAPAVKKFNERATTGKLIENYYKSIIDSNIPEVYKLSLVIRYELLNKVEISAIQKAFADFKKSFEKLTYLKLVSAYLMSYDEYKELQIFFYPISDGHKIGLETKNDIISLTNKLCGTNKDTMNIVEAMPLFTDFIDKTVLAPINAGQFISQEELEVQARHISDVDPMEIHAIAVETLKAQMNSLQKINAENQKLESAIESEKQRIEYDLKWSKETAEKIREAEEQRIEEEKRLAEEARRAEAARMAAEAQKREEERLREEARRVEAERLAEQARRNIELRKQMAKQEEELAQRRMLRKQIDHEEFARLLAQHMEWQEFYGINDETEYDHIPSDAAKDPRRMVMKMCDIASVDLSHGIVLIGAIFDDCEFDDCQISGIISACALNRCSFANSEMNDLAAKKCAFDHINIDRLAIDNMNIDESTVMKLSAQNTVFSEIVSAPTTTYVKCNFSNAVFKGCDLKKNTFTNCNFTEATLSTCDFRDSVFQVCKIDTMNKEGSLFRGVKINTK